MGAIQHDSKCAPILTYKRAPPLGWHYPKGVATTRGACCHAVAKAMMLLIVRALPRMSGPRLPAAKTRLAGLLGISRD